MAKYEARFLGRKEKRPLHLEGSTASKEEACLISPEAKARGNFGETYIRFFICEIWAGSLHKKGRFPEVSRSTANV